VTPGHASNAEKTASDAYWKNLDWKRIFGGDGLGESHWDAVKALAMYRKSEGDLLIRFKDGRDPRSMKIQVSPEGKVSVMIDKADFCVVRGLEIRNAHYAARVERAKGVVIENCVMDPVDFGIHLGEGSENCVVRGNDFSYRPLAGADYMAPGEWDAWRACKIGGFWNRHGVKIIATKGGHRIHDNKFHDCWDGIHIESFGYGTPAFTAKPKSEAEANLNKDIEIDHNLFDFAYDNGIKICGSARGLKFHDNLLRHNRCAIRVFMPTAGPLFIYRNVFVENAEDLRNYIEFSDADADAEFMKTETWFYQNTGTAKAAFNLLYHMTDETYRLASAPNFRLFNNLFWCRSWIAKSNKKIPNPDWKADFNVYLQIPPAVQYPWAQAASGDVKGRQAAWDEGVAMAEKSGIEVNAKWIASERPGFVDAWKGDFSLALDSPARGAGTDLSKMRTLQGEPLPGVSGDGEAPDAGALKFGEPMLKVPRPLEKAGL